MGLLDQQFTKESIVVTKVEDLLNWARLSSNNHIGNRYTQNGN